MVIALWIVQVLLGLIFVITGSFKFFQSKEKVIASGGTWAEDFAPAIIKLIAGVELVSGLLLLISKLSGQVRYLTFIGAACIALIMIGSIYTHIRRKEFKHAVINGVFLLMAVFVVYAVESFYFQVTLTDAIGIFTGVATGSAALATFLTVWEIKKQRESSYLPDICIDTFTVTVHGSSSTNQILASRFKGIDNFDNEFQENEESISKYVKVKLQNLGLGAAKKIEFRWDFDVSKATEIVRSTPNYDGHFSDIAQGYSELEKMRELSIIPSLGYRFTGIPRIVWIHYLYCFALRQLTADRYRTEFPELPQPKLTIHYSDIQDNSFAKSFSFFLTISESSSQEEQDKIAVIMVEVKENK